jgi:hypothetical protein
MARTTPRPLPTATRTVQPLGRDCPLCGETMWAADHHYRPRTILEAVVPLTRPMRRCLTCPCPQFRHPDRPDAEGRLAWPTHAFGLDVIACVGQWRYGHHRSVAAMHQAVVERSVVVAPRTVTNLLERYEAWGALSLPDPPRLQPITPVRGRVILALDGWQPDVGHAVLWVLRDGLSGAVLLARRVLSAPQADLAKRFHEVQQALQVPMVGVITDGPPAIRAAVSAAFPAVPHHWCHVPSRRAAATAISAADRHAKKGLPKRGRGLRPLARR